MSGKFEIRPPELLSGFLLKINNMNYSWALLVKPRTAVQQNYRCWLPQCPAPLLTNQC